MSSLSHLLQKQLPLSPSEDVIRVDGASFYNRYGEDIIIKTLKCSSEEEAREFSEAYRLAQNHPHKHVCECLDILIEPAPDDPPHFNVVQVWKSLKRSLSEDILQRSSANPVQLIEPMVLNDFLQQLVEVLCDLQLIGVAHRDISPANICYNSPDCLKLIGFNLAKAIEGPFVRTMAGEKLYMAPALRRALFMQAKNEKLMVQHNVFKSDVYSLGMVMLHLSRLELKAEWTNLQQLEDSLKVALDRVAKTHSLEWANVLRCMLEVDEENRPDFIQLKDKINAELRFYPEEKPTAAIKNLQFVKLSLHSSREYIRVSPTLVDSTPCQVTIKAAKRRICEVDIVCVVDQSGSVMENYQSVIVKAMHILVSQLGEIDRLAVVGFSDTANLILPLTCCTDTGKQKIMDSIRQLSAMDLTNLESGVTLGLQVLLHRKHKNRFSRLVIISDGKYNIGADPRKCIEALTNSGIDEFRVYCLGLNFNENPPEIMRNLAVCTGGEYHRLSRDAPLSVLPEKQTYATNLSLSLSLLPIPQTKFTLQTYSTSRMDSLLPGTQHQVIFHLIPAYKQLPGTCSCPVVDAILQYTDHAGAPASKKSTLDVQLKDHNSSPPAILDNDIYLRWHYEEGQEYLRKINEVAQTGNQTETLRLVNLCRDFLQGSGFADDRIISNFLSEVVAVERQFLGKKCDSAGTSSTNTTQG